MCRNVEACMCGCAPSVTVIVCETLWCDHLLEDLLCYQTYTPSASLSPLLSHYSILTIWYCCTLCVRHLIQELKIQQDIRQPETSRYQNTKHPIYSLTKKLKSQSPACSRQFIPPPDTQTMGMNQPESERACWARTDSLAWGQCGHPTHQHWEIYNLLVYGWKFLLDHIYGYILYVSSNIWILMLSRHFKKPFPNHDLYQIWITYFITHYLTFNQISLKYISCWQTQGTENIKFM